MTAPSVIIPVGILALVIVCLAADRALRHDWTRARLGAWITGWLLLGAVLALAAGMRRAGGLGLRKLAGRIRAIRPARQPQPAPERPLPPKPYQARHGKPRMAASAR